MSTDAEKLSTWLAAPLLVARRPAVVLSSTLQGSLTTRGLNVKEGKEHFHEKFLFNSDRYDCFDDIAAAAVADPGTTWDKVIQGKDRFQVLKAFNHAAVLDTETGRVGEQSPSTGTFLWVDALSHCYTLEVGGAGGRIGGGRKGWRLPTIEELASLVDTSQLNPTLPAGHPFSNVKLFHYWSAATAPLFLANDEARIMNFVNGDISFAGKSSFSFSVWCVRGGQGIDGVHGSGTILTQ